MRKRFTDEMLVELLKASEDPNYEGHLILEPTDQEIDVMMPALFRETLAARKVIKVAQQVQANVDELTQALMIYRATTDLDGLINGDQ
jgi:hypothetical protein